MGIYFYIYEIAEKPKLTKELIQPIEATIYISFNFKKEIFIEEKYLKKLK